jgi:hypothetical protein
VHVVRVRGCDSQLARTLHEIAEKPAVVNPHNVPRMTAHAVRVCEVAPDEATWQCHRWTRALPAEDLEQQRAVTADSRLETVDRDAVGPQLRPQLVEMLHGGCIVGHRALPTEPRGAHLCERLECFAGVAAASGHGGLAFSDELGQRVDVDFNDLTLVQGRGVGATVCHRPRNATPTPVSESRFDFLVLEDVVARGVRDGAWGWATA